MHARHCAWNCDTDQKSASDNSIKNLEKENRWRCGRPTEKFWHEFHSVITDKSNQAKSGYAYANATDARRDEWVSE